MQGDIMIARVVFVLGLKLPFPGAGWRRIEYFAKYLASRNMRVYIIGTITPSIGKTQKSKTKAQRSKYSILNIQPGLPTSILNFLSSLFVTLAILLIRPHVVIVSVPTVEQVYASYLGAKLVRAKFVVDIRDPAEDSMIKFGKGIIRKAASLIKAINYAIYRRANAVTTVTYSLVNYLARNGVKAHLVPNGADLKIFKPMDKTVARRELGFNDDDLVLLFSGYLGFGHYDISPILKALNEIQTHMKERNVHKKLKIVLVGGIARAFTRKRKLQLQEYIDYRGVIEDINELVKIYSAADIGIIPRVDDPFFDYSIPVKFYEYIALGLPVFALCRRSSELASIIEKYDVGWVCEPKDIDCIMKTLEHICLNPNEVAKKRENSLKLRPYIDRLRSAVLLAKMIDNLIKATE